MFWSNEFSEHLHPKVETHSELLRLTLVGQFQLRFTTIRYRVAELLVAISFFD